MQVNIKRLVKACSMVSDELVRVSADELKGFSFIAEFHIDSAGFVRTVKTNKVPDQVSFRVGR